MGSSDLLPCDQALTPAAGHCSGCKPAGVLQESGLFGGPGTAEWFCARRLDGGA